ncbi:MAG: prolipoprotein diacylglyceryl transferase [Eubacteriales bacterium]|nr:prolipoprotein diacylglyceryl transferase [Eubacteriales bacterium]
MNSIAMYIGDYEIYWSSVIITLGMICCLTMTLALYKPRNESTAAVWIFFPLAFIFSFLFSRVLHYYFNAESYKSFLSAMTDYSNGSYVLPGMLLGIWLAASLVSRMGLVSSAARLLDFLTPGVLLLISFIRLSALFNESCRSKIIINIPLFQRLPFSVGSTDPAGNTTFRLATFFIEFIIVFILAFWSLSFFQKNRNLRMQPPCPRAGNIMRIFLTAYGAVEIIMDSTRYDSPLMHFRFLSSLNQYSAFISLAQIFAAVSAIAVLIFYSRMSMKAAGFSWKHPVLWLVFLASLFGMGYLGEYRVQRYGTQKYFECYGIMAASCILMFLCVFFMYRMCLPEKEYYE